MNAYKIVLVSLIHRNNKSEILLTKRKREPEVDKWSLPGGTGALETEPDPQVAILKEVMGDFGVDIVHPKLFCTKFTINPEPTLRLYFEGELNGEPQIKGLRTIKELKWFQKEDISKEDFAFKEVDLDVVHQFFRSSTSQAHP